MGRFHYATSREPELSFFRIALPATVFRYQSLQRAGERTSLLLGIYNMLKNSPTESFFKKFFIFFSFTFRLAYARQIIDGRETAVNLRLSVGSEITIHV